MKKNIDPATLPYRKCVGMAVFNEAGQVWAGQRRVKKHDEMTGAEKLWQLPQGGINEGEEPLAAAYRELWEETGMRSVTLLGQMDGWIDYDLPPDLVGLALYGQYRGQRQKWFAMRFNGQVDEIAINPPPQGHEREFEAWAWVPLAQIPHMVVPFKQAVYEQVVACFQPMIQA